MPFEKGDKNHAKKPEVRIKISNAKKGKHCSPETEFKKGRTYKMSEEHKRKISETQKGEKNSFYNKHHSEESKKKLIRRGEKNHLWKGGITLLSHLIRNCFEYRQWRCDIFTRDDFTCQECNKRGGDLEAHHLKEFNKILEDNNIKILEEALSCEELWNINNGITLCLNCHNKTKIYWRNQYTP